MIDSSLLLTFLAIAKHGNLQKAASSLSITAPAVCQRLKVLEDQLGKNLFLRSSSGMVLSSHGKELFQKSTKIFDALTDIDHWSKAKSPEVSGEVTVFAISTIISFMLPKFLKHFLKRYPKVTPRFYEGISAEVEEALLSGRADLGIIAGGSQKNSLTIQRLIEDNRVLAVCAPEYFLAKKTNITRNDLNLATFIWHAHKSSRTRRKICNILKISVHSPINTIDVQTMEQAIPFAKEGLGVAFVARIAVAQELKQKKLIELPCLKLNTPINIVARNDVSLSPQAQTFKDDLVKFCYC